MLANETRAENSSKWQCVCFVKCFLSFLIGGDNFQHTFSLKHRLFFFLFPASFCVSLKVKVKERKGIPIVFLAIVLRVAEHLAAAAAAGAAVHLSVAPVPVLTFHYFFTRFGEYFLLCLPLFLRGAYVFIRCASSH